MPAAHDAAHHAVHDAEAGTGLLDLLQKIPRHLTLGEAWVGGHDAHDKRIARLNHEPHEKDHAAQDGDAEYEVHGYAPRGCCRHSILASTQGSSEPIEGQAHALSNILRLRQTGAK